MVQPLFSLLPVVALLVALPLLSGCEAGSQPPADVPETHTVNEDGVWHAEGARNPDDNCASCHGITEAVDSGVACIDCHSAASIANGDFEDESDSDSD